MQNTTNTLTHPHEAHSHPLERTTAQRFCIVIPQHLTRRTVPKLKVTFLGLVVQEKIPDAQRPRTFARASLPVFQQLQSALVILVQNVFLDLVPLRFQEHLCPQYPVLEDFI